MFTQWQKKEQLIYRNEPPSKKLSHIMCEYKRFKQKYTKVVKPSSAKRSNSSDLNCTGFIVVYNLLIKWMYETFVMIVNHPSE